MRNLNKPKVLKRKLPRFSSTEITEQIKDELAKGGISVEVTKDDDFETGNTYFKTDADWISGSIVEYIVLKRNFSAISISLYENIVFEFKFDEDLKIKEAINGSSN